MKKWNMIIDVEKCHNSNNCFLSVADEYMGNEHPGYSTAMPKHGHHWINILRNERGQAPMVDVSYLPTMCNHCDDAPCMKVAKNDAIFMHCLPASRGDEVTDEIIDGKQSAVWLEALNRIHVQKSIIEWCLK